MQPSEDAQIDLGKAQVIDRTPKIIKELKFGVLYGFPACLKTKLNYSLRGMR